MMNIGETPVLSTHGVVTSLAWGMQGKINYVLEGNINYTGAVNYGSRMIGTDSVAGRDGRILQKGRSRRQSVCCSGIYRTLEPVLEQ